MKPAWTYGIEIWGSTKKSNRNKLQVMQNKVLRCIAKAPWYVTNNTLHQDLLIDTVDETIKKKGEQIQCSSP